MNSMFRDVCEVAIVGAGPYGLSLAAHLKAGGIETRVFGDPLSFWRQNMPQGMLVRSAWDATHIVDPGNRFSLDACAAATGLRKPDPLPRADFARYGEWFQRQAVPDLDRRKVARRSRSPPSPPPIPCPASPSCRSRSRARSPAGCR